MARSRKVRPVALPVKDLDPPVTQAKPAVIPLAYVPARGFVPTLHRVIAMMNPTTWCPPMWAFLCGAVASGHLGDGPDSLVRTLLGIVMAGPVLLGFAQIVQHFSDRDTHETGARRDPDAPIPPVLIPTTRIILIGAILLVLGLMLASALGRVVAILAAAGVLLGLVYSMPPLRFKRSGWLSSGIRALAFVGLPWLAGTAALSTDPLPPVSAILAALFTIGAFGGATVADFVSIAGDRDHGIRTLPVLLGPRDAAICCTTLLCLAQVVVVEFAISQGYPLVGGVLTLSLLVQWLLLRIWIARPEEKARWFLNTGVLLVMLGMIVAAFGVAAQIVTR